MRRGILLGVVAAITVACAPSGGSRVLVAAGTTLVDSGLIDHVVAAYEASHPGINLAVTGDASAKILALADQGAVDVAITHAPALEAAFLAGPRAGLSGEAFTSRFVLVGPSGPAGQLDGLDAPAAFSTIAAKGWVFVSRDDGSGTNERERAIWREAGIDPTGRPWYITTGLGMGETLQIASDRQAFTLAELGTFLVAAPTLSLVDAHLTEDGLTNPYRATVVAGSTHENQATRFVEWLLSPDGKAAILAADQAIFGEVVYRPAG